MNPNCPHELAAELNEPDFLDHWHHCLNKPEQDEWLLQWRDAARKWWDHQEREFQRGNFAKSEQGTPPGLDVKAGEMGVWVILPSGAITLLAHNDPLSADTLATISKRDREIIATLLRVAQSELTPPYAYGQPLPWPVPEPMVP